MTRNPEPEPRFSDDEVREILRRSAELELTSNETSLRDLLEIGKDVGLKTEAVLRAATEVAAARSKTDDSFRNKVTKALLAGTTLGLVTGLLEILVFQNSLVDIPSFVLLVVMGWTLFEPARRRSRIDALRQLGSLLIGYAAGWSAINLDFTGDLLIAVVLAGLLSTSLSTLTKRFARIFDTRYTAI